ncbi:hypothetical protein CN395_26125 [Priestia megaterium]|uniref:hypothetical protein n=1 Tax=Priestia megaterium TaxID=1404 RepID=UPI000BF5D6BF|nr:hypothetical protein [Priestia megaterium]PEU53759.1 hypothetical protein CN395_26125 [Priestia megaterium]
MEALDKTFTKYGEEVYPYYYKDDLAERIYVKGSPSDKQLENNVCTIIFKVEHCSVHITEIPLTGYENKGYGSVAMRALIKHSINKGYLGITGLLAPYDPSHAPRLIYFYEKNSFDIKLNSNRDRGKIQLDLTNPNKLLKNLTTIPFQERISLLENQLKMQRQKEKELQEKIASLEHDIANESKVLKFLKRFFKKYL